MFLNNRRHLRLAQLAQAIRAIVALIALVVCAQQYIIAQAALQGRFPAPGAGAASDQRIETATLLHLGAAIVAFLTLAAWMYRAYQNAHKLPDAQPTHVPSMAVWGWFIPIANLWYPCRIMDEIGHYTGRYSQPAEHSLSFKWANIVGVWWVLHIGSFLVAQAGRLLNSTAADNLASLLVFDRLLIFSYVLSFGSAVVALILLQIIAPYEQRLLAQSGNL